MTLADALAAARARGLARLDAQLLLGHVLGRERAWLIAHDGDLLASPEASAFDTLCARRADGEPLAYLVGRKEFRGLDLEVTPDVLVPRPDTELIVDWALELLAGLPGAPAVVDLGTGSGAIALAVAAAAGASGPSGPRVCATDASAAALAVARRNAQRLGLPIEFVHGSWWRPLADRRFALALSNPPYIAAADPHLEALRHEPSLALTPSGDGLDALRAISAGARGHLEPGGWLLLEHGHDQAEAVAALLGAAGFDAIEHREDLAGHRRCTGGRR